eukprot:gene8901-biopygen6412
MAAEALRQLHPEEAQENFPRPEEVDVHLNVSAQDVPRAIRKRMSRGACPGINGWTRELLMPILEHDDLVEDLAVSHKGYRQPPRLRQLRRHSPPEGHPGQRPPHHPRERLAPAAVDSGVGQAGLLRQEKVPRLPAWCLGGSRVGGETDSWGTDL